MVSRSALDRARSALHLRLLAAQRRLVSTGRGAVILLGGNDRLGASALANQLTEWFDSRRVRICAPDGAAAELRGRPFLWPYWQMMPALQAKQPRRLSYLNFAYGDLFEITKRQESKPTQI